MATAAARLASWRPLCTLRPLPRAAPTSSQAAPDLGGHGSCHAGQPRHSCETLPECRHYHRTRLCHDLSASARARSASSHPRAAPCLHSREPLSRLSQPWHHRRGASGRQSASGAAVRQKRLDGRRPVPVALHQSLQPAAVHLAASLFTFATAFVIPIYSVMIFAPEWAVTRRVVESSIPYAVLGALYLYLLALSWTPQTLPLMFSSKYWLPELPAITRMFSSTLTVASAWIHLLAVDLFAGRHVYLDGYERQVETRHSLVLCLMFGPVGILSHVLTKLIVGFSRPGGRRRPPPLNPTVLA